MNCIASGSFRVADVCVKLGLGNTSKLEGRGYDAEGPSAVYTDGKWSAFVIVGNWSQNQAYILRDGGELKNIQLLPLNLRRAACFPSGDFVVRSVYILPTLLYIAITTANPKCPNCAILSTVTIGLDDFKPTVANGQYADFKVTNQAHVAHDADVMICDQGGLIYYNRTGRTCDCGFTKATAFEDRNELNGQCDDVLTPEMHVTGTYGSMVAFEKEHYVGVHVLVEGKPVYYFADSIKVLINNAILYSLQERGTLAVYVLVDSIWQPVCVVNGCKNIEKYGQYVHLVLENSDSETRAIDALNQKALIEAAAYAVLKASTKQTDADSAVSV